MTNKGKESPRSEELLKDFTQYCKENPNQRFWQALLMWSGWSYLYVTHTPAGDSNLKDTFYWESKYPKVIGR